MRVEAVTDNIHVNTKRHTMVVRLLKLCDESLENTDLIFAALRARLRDGLDFDRHLSVIKILWLIELLAHYGPLVVLDCLPSLEKYLAEAAQYYASKVDSAFFPALEKCQELLDMIGTPGSPGACMDKGEGKPRSFSIEDAVRISLTDLDEAIKKINRALRTKIDQVGRSDSPGRIVGTSDPLGEKYGFSAEGYRQELLSLLDSAMTSNKDQVDMVCLQDLLANLQSSSEEKADVAAVLGALKEHLACTEPSASGSPQSTLTAQGAVQCRKVFEVLNYLFDNRIDILSGDYQSVFNKEDLQKYATNFNFEIAGLDLGYAVRREAARLLDLPIIGSFEEGAMDLAEVSLSFNGSFSRFDSASDSEGGKEDPI